MKALKLMVLNLLHLAQKATNPSWYSIPIDASARATPAASSELPTSESISAPSDYFKRFFDETIVNYIVAQSNLYAVQQMNWPNLLQ